MPVGRAVQGSDDPWLADRGRATATLRRVEFPEPTDARDNRTDVLLGYLDYFRDRAITEVEGLNPDEAGASRLPSGWSPMELLHHLRHVERRWLEWGSSASTSAIGGRTAAATAGWCRPARPRPR
jgi:hypothetical protein